MKKTATLLVVMLMSVAMIYGQKFEQNFSGIDEIQLTTGSANCRVVKSSGNTVTVTLDHNLGSDYQPIVENRNGKLTIRDNDKRPRGEMNWTLSIPDNIELKYTAGSGNIEIENLAIDLTSISGSGNIELNGVTGSITSTTGSGNIEIDNFDGDFKANTGSGNIKGDQVKGTLKVNCGSGMISFSNVQAEIKGNVGSGDIRITNFILAGNSAFNSGSGDVSVKLGATPTHGLSMNSGSGNSVLDRNGHALNADIVMTASKKNGKISAPFKFDKEEEVEEGNQIIMKKYASLGSGNKVEISMGTGSGTAQIK
jgi:hypothetical protein